MPALLDDFKGQNYHFKQVIASWLIAPIDSLYTKIIGKEVRNRSCSTHESKTNRLMFLSSGFWLLYDSDNGGN